MSYVCVMWKLGLMTQTSVMLYTNVVLLNSKELLHWQEVLTRRSVGHYVQGNSNPRLRLNPKPDLPQDRPICSSDPQEAQLTQSSNYEHMFKIQIIIRHSKSLPLHFYLFLQKSTTTLPPSDWGLELHHFLCRDTSVQFLDLVWPGSSFTVQQTTEHQQHMYKQYTRCLPILYSI